MIAASEIQTATPVEIDTELAELDGQSWKLSAQIGGALDFLHGVADDKHLTVRTGRKTWAMTHVEAERVARERVSTDTAPRFYRTSAAEVIECLDAYRAELAVVGAEIGELDAEFDRRPWSRFFLVQNHGGHVHSSKRCQTCNKMGLATEFGWLPEWSGRSETEALAALRADRQAIMCSICFPNAPAEWHTAVAKPVDERYCTGQGQYALEPQMRYSSPRGTCPVCKQRGTSVSRNGKVLKHQKPDAK